MDQRVRSECFVIVQKTGNAAMYDESAHSFRKFDLSHSSIGVNLTLFLPGRVRCGPLLKAKDLLLKKSRRFSSTVVLEKQFQINVLRVSPSWSS